MEGKRERRFSLDDVYRTDNDRQGHRFLLTLEYMKGCSFHCDIVLLLTSVMMMMHMGST